MPHLYSSGRLAGFLCEAAVTISSDLRSTSHLAVYLRGLGQALSKEGLGAGVMSALRCGLCVMYCLVCEAVTEMSNEETRVPRDLVALLMDASVWKEMARCLVFAGACKTRQPCLYVDVTMCCSQITGAFQPFKSLTPSLHWVLDTLPGTCICSSLTA